MLARRKPGLGTHWRERQPVASKKEALDFWFGLARACGVDRGFQRLHPSRGPPPWPPTPAPKPVPDSPEEKVVDLFAGLE